jgi:phosphoglucosamine mutase
MDKLFSADGIRGKIDYGILSSESLERLGMALAIWWKDQDHSAKILIGRDTRESGERIKQHLVKGLTCGGVKVVDGGILTTPAISFLIIHTGGFNGGISLSGSHLPVIENGIKIFNQNGTKIDDATELIIENLFSSNLPKPTNSFQASVSTAYQLVDLYVEELIAEYTLIGSQKKIAIDYANGAASAIAEKVFSRLKIKPLSINMSPNGANINRKAGSEYARHLPREFANEFKRYGCEIGIALDGDGDRVAFIDQNGKFYDGDMLLSMLALDLKNHGKLDNDAIVITQMSNSGLERHLGTHNIKTMTVRNGDKYITDAILNNDLILGGEQIGHIIIHTDKTRVTGDGLRTALWVLGELCRQPDVELGDLMGGLKKWPQVHTSVYLHERTTLMSDQVSGLSDILHWIREKIPDLSRIECRPASTEPSYRIMLEAQDTPVHVLADFARQVASHVQKELGSQGHPVEILDCINGGNLHFPL